MLLCRLTKDSSPADLAFYFELNSQCTLDLGVKLFIIKSHKNRGLGGTHGGTGPATLAECLVYHGHGLLIVKTDRAIGAHIYTPTASGT